MIGFMGAGVRAAAGGLTARTGLPLFDLERDVESSLGMTRSQILLERGPEPLARGDARALERALNDGAPGVLALSHGALLDATSRARVLEHTHLVYIERPLDVLLQRIVDQLSAAPASIPEFMLAPPGSAADLAPLFAEREPAYLQAPSVLAARDLHAHQLVDALLQDLRSGKRGGHSHVR